MRARAFAGCLVLLLACSTASDNGALDLSGKDLSALEWGMDAETAKSRLLGIDGISLTSDSTFPVPGGGYPAYMSPETVEVRAIWQPPRSVRWVGFSGGQFLEHKTKGWMLLFSSDAGLIEVNIALDGIEKPRRQEELIRRKLEARYGPPRTIFGGKAYDIHAFSADTTAPPNTRLSMWGSYDNMIQIRYASIHYQDSVDAWYDAHPRKRMHISDYEALLQAHKEDH